MSSCSQPTQLGWSLEDISCEFDADQRWWRATHGVVSILSVMMGVHWALCACFTQAWSLNTVCPTCPSLDPEISGLGLTEQWYISHGLASQRQCSLRQRWAKKFVQCSNQGGWFACEWCFAHQKCWVRMHWGGPLSLLWVWQDSRVWVACLSSSPWLELHRYIPVLR